MRILALFSATSNDLGLDHRLGRQVLKLASAKASQLHPSLPGLQLLVHSDQSDCDSLNLIPNKVAEQFYSVLANGAQCKLPPSPGGEQEWQVERCFEEQGFEFGSSANESSGEVEAELHVEHELGVDALIGPSCDFLVDLVARMAAYWQTPVYSQASIGASFGRKDVYPTLTRLSPSIDQLSMFVVRIMQKFAWRHLAILVDGKQVENRMLLSNFEQTIRRHRLQVAIEHKVFSLDGFGLSNESSLACGPKELELLSSARKVARVFLLLQNNHQIVRQLLVCGHQLSMNNGEFTFLALDLGLKSSGALKRAANAPGAPLAASSLRRARISQAYDWYVQDDEASNQIARQMFESLMVISAELPVGDEFNLFVEQTLDLANQEYPGVQFERASVGAVAVALHDSLLLAVEAFMRRGARGGRARVAPLWNERYSNGLMASLFINANGDQELDYILSDLEPETGQMRPAARYSSAARQLELIPGGYIHWPRRLNPEGRQISDSDEPPPDEPECGFTGEAERCVDRENLHAALTIVSILALLILASSSICLLKYRRIKYQMQLDDYWWRVSWQELQFIQLNAADSLASTPQSVARVLKAGGSVVSAANSDGAHSMVSLVRPRRALASSKRQQASAAAAAAAAAEQAPRSGRQRERRAAVPLIVTLDGDRESAATTSAASGGHGSASNRANSNEATNAASVISDACLIRSEFSSVVKASNLAMYKNELVIVKQLNGKSIEVSRDLLVELKSMRDHINENLAKFVGLCLEPERLSIVYEYCSRGSLQDMLLNESVSMDWTLKYSIIGDIVSGLSFIHSTLLDYHGRLKSTNLVLDSRFTVKITDFGLQNLYSQLEAIEDREEDAAEEGEEEEVGQVGGPGERGRRADQMSLSVSQAAQNMDSVSARGHSLRSGGERRMYLKNRGAARYFWTAPEHLRNKDLHFAGSKRGDIYSLAVILSEIFTRREPYHYGSNAKPHWLAIRRDRPASRAAGEFRAGQSPAVSGGSHFGARSSQVAGSEVSSRAGASLVSSIGRQAKRAQGRLKRGSAAVSPAASRCEQVQASAALEPQPDAASLASTSVHSLTSSHSNVSSAQAQNAAQLHAIRSSVGAIEEGAEPEEEEAEAAVAEGEQLGPAEGGGALAPGGASGGGGRRASERIDAEEILDQLRMGIQPEPVRPYIPNYTIQELDPKLVELMRACWSESPLARPTIGQVRNQLRRITRGVASKNYLDNLLERLQNYAANLECIVDSRSADIVAEKYRTEELLYQLVPKFVADKLKRNEPIVPQVFDGVTIFFSDIVGFEKYASVMSPSELVDLLNNIYSSFESIISSFDVTKIETIIDQFLIASGISLQQELGRQMEQQVASPGSRASKSPLELPSDQSAAPSEQATAAKPGAKSRFKSKKSRLFGSLRRSHGSSELEQERADSLEAGGEDSISQIAEQTEELRQEVDHYRRNSAEQIGRMALCIRDLVKSFHFRQRDQDGQASAASKTVAATNFNIRIGIHSGKVCAGIVGLKRPKYCLIGDTVNVASRMHTNSKANRIQISADTKRLLERVPGFSIEPRGLIEVKGKGAMETFWLESSY